MEKQARKRKQTPVQIGVDQEVYRRLRERAAAEGRSLAGWLRFLALRELKRGTRTSPELPRTRGTKRGSR